MKPFSLLLLIVTCLGTLIGVSNCENHRVMAGFAGYVYEKPIFGHNQFERILIGPASTGYVWRREVCKVSVTPETTKEVFDAAHGGAILGSDKLPISCTASIVFRLDTTKIKSFMEDYGGIAQSSGRNDDEVADEVMLFAYKNFIQQPFRTAIRAELSRYNALDASSNLQLISDNVTAAIRDRMKNTPFLVDSVVVGETNPPQEIIDSVVKKVQTTQENERKDTELQIAKKEIEIKRAQGEAEGAMKLEVARQEAEAAKARGAAEAEVVVMQGQARAEAALAAARAEAEGMRLKDEALGQNMLQWKQFESMYNNAKLYIPSSDGCAPGMGILGLMNLDTSTPTQQPAQQPAAK